MRISCQSIDDFITNLKVHANSVYRKVIYVDRVREPLNGSTYSDCSAWDIGFSANCLIVGSDAIESLLSVSEYCGVDRDSQPVSDVGTANFHEFVKQLTAFCAQVDLQIMPGTLEI